MEEHADENIPALAEEKLRLIRAQADLAEQKLQRETEILISKDAVKERLGNMLGVITGILKTTLSRQDYSAVARQFQQADFNL